MSRDGVEPCGATMQLPRINSMAGLWKGGTSSFEASRIATSASCGSMPCGTTGTTGTIGQFQVDGVIPRFAAQAPPALLQSV